VELFVVEPLVSVWIGGTMMVADMTSAPRIRMSTRQMVVCGTVARSMFDVSDWLRTPLELRLDVRADGTMVVVPFVMRPERVNVSEPEPGVPSALVKVWPIWGVLKLTDTSPAVVIPGRPLGTQGLLSGA
jgi:hypothetical protein